MPTKSKRAFCTYLTICVFASLLAIIFSILVKVVAWQNIWSRLGSFLYEFQTLITGIAAVIAATVTVWTMYRLDVKAEERHKAALLIAKLPYLTQLERALNPQMKDLQIRLDELDKLYLGMKRYTAESQFIADHCVVREIKRIGSGISKILQRKAFIHGEVLFEGLLSKNLETLEDLTDRIYRFFQDPEPYYSFDTLSDIVLQYRKLIPRIINLMEKAKLDNGIQ